MRNPTSGDSILPTARGRHQTAIEVRQGESLSEAQQRATIISGLKPLASSVVPKSVEANRPRLDGHTDLKLNAVLSRRFEVVCQDLGDELRGSDFIHLCGGIRNRFHNITAK